MSNKSIDGTVARAIKSVNETLNNSTAFQDDDDLFFSILEGETWIFNISLIVDEADVNPNFKLNMAATNGLTGSIAYAWEKVSAAGARGVVSDFTTGSGNISITTTQEQVKVEGSVTATASGVLQLQWAQNISDADVVTVYAHSSLYAIKVD